MAVIKYQVDNVLLYVITPNTMHPSPQDAQTKFKKLVYSANSYWVGGKPQPGQG